MKTPNSKNEITLKWLKHILRNSEYKNPSTFEIDNSFNNQSILGEIVKIRINNSNGVQKSLIVKFQKCSNKTRESHIYNLLLNAGINSIPKIVHSCTDGTIIMEDLSWCSIASIVNGCNIEKAKNVLSAIADIHNKFINKNDVPIFDYKKFSKVIDYNMQQSWSKYVNQYPIKIGSLEKDFYWIWQNPEIVSKTYVEGKLALSHGDLHLENILFQTNDEVKIIDWQLSDKKNMAFDISYFLIQNLTLEQRKTSEKQLIEYYYNLLSEDIKENYSYKNFLLGYRACITRSMVSSVMYNGDRFKHRNDYREFSDTIAERVISAVNDWNPIEAVKELESISN